jgi:hypothetical protein
MKKAIVVFTVVALLASAIGAVAIFTGRSSQTREEAVAGEGGMPTALARHLEELARTIPGAGGESQEGPGSAAADEFFQRAYPDSDIPPARRPTR